MSDKKNIDRLFQERFKDFEAVPTDKIWKNIHDALHEKRKRKVIPLWWKFSGIAAGFLIAFLAFNPFSNTTENNPTVVVTPKEIEKTKPTTETGVAVEKENSSLNENNLNSTTKTENRIAVENNSDAVNEEDSQAKSNQNSQNKKNNFNTFSTKKQRNKASKNNAVAKNSKANLKQNLIKNKTAPKESVVFDSFSTKKSNQKNQLETKENNLNNNESVVSNETNFSSKNANKSIILIDKDSTKTTENTEPNPLEEILNKKNEKEELLAVAKINKWQVTTNVAPVYFNSASNGSPIEAQFKENSKSYENNLSVGIGVQYSVNKKLAIRTGVNKVTLGYATNDVVFFGGLNSSGFGTLSSGKSTSNIEVFSANNTEGLRPFSDNSQNTESGVLNQRMGYYEVPLELSYALVNRKFGINVIGGLSTLFLNENSVSVQSATTTMTLGKATNLNDIHFSSNIGLGFKYEFWKNFEAHFEPTFKYQLNTFSRDSGNFKPYFVGLYTGISFKF